jgi:hypothetical protein
MFYSTDQTTFKKLLFYTVKDLPNVFHYFYLQNFKKRIWFYDENMKLIAFIN